VKRNLRCTPMRLRQAPSADTIVADSRPRAAKRRRTSRVEAALKNMRESSRAEPGNLDYQVLRDPKDPRVFVLYERYTDESAFAAHRATSRFNPIGTFAGIYFLETGILGLQLLGLDAWVSRVFYGGVLVVAVTISTLLHRRTT
jgi:quinol monooxygenase YgiN